MYSSRIIKGDIGYFFICILSSKGQPWYVLSICSQPTFALVNIPAVGYEAQTSKHSRWWVVNGPLASRLKVYSPFPDVSIDIITEFIPASDLAPLMSPRSYRLSVMGAVDLG